MDSGVFPVPIASWRVSRATAPKHEIGANRVAESPQATATGVPWW